MKAPMFVVVVYNASIWGLAVWLEFSKYANSVCRQEKRTELWPWTVYIRRGDRLKSCRAGTREQNIRVGIRVVDPNPNPRILQTAEADAWIPGCSRMTYMYL